MIAVVTDKNEIRVSIPTEGMGPEAVEVIVDWLRVEFAARRSKLMDETAWHMSEDIKAEWWAQNKARFIERKP
jgi:hypothetical protein